MSSRRAGESTQKRGKAGAIATVVALLLAAAALAVPFRMGKLAAGLDFYQFWAGAQLARSVDDIYSADVREGEYQPFQQRAFACDESNKLLIAARMRNDFEFFSTPFLYTAFGVLPEQYDRALSIYQVISLLALIGGVLLAARAVGLSWGIAGLLLAFIAFLFEGVKSEVRVANVNFIQLFMVALGLWLARERARGRSIAAGLVLAVVTMFKPNLAPIVPLLLFYRIVSRDRVRLLWESVGVASGIVLSLIASSIYFRGFDAWLAWVGRAQGLAASLLPLSSGNVAPALMLANDYGTGAVLALSLALTIFVAAAAFLGSRHSVDRDDAPFVAGLGLLVYLLSASLVWLHYLVLAIPAAIALIGDRTSRVRQTIGAVALTLVGLDIWLIVLRIRTEKAQALVLWIGLALLFTASLWKLADRRPVGHLGVESETPSPTPGSRRR